MTFSGALSEGRGTMTGWKLVEPEGGEDDHPLVEWIERAVKFVGTLPTKCGETSG